jgi:hypothetical protein
VIHFRAGQNEAQWVAFFFAIQSRFFAATAENPMTFNATRTDEGVAKLNQAIPKCKVVY